MESPPNADLVGRDSVEPRGKTPLRQRRHPAKGVFIFLSQATIVFVTVCSRERKKQLANAVVHKALVNSVDEGGSMDDRRGTSLCRITFISFVRQRTRSA